MGHIFVSYARVDSGTVDKIVNQIEDNGYQVWIDRGGIRPGEQWTKTIVDAIESANTLLIVLSRNSVQSDNVRREIDLATSANKNLIPISIENVEIPPALKYQLAGVQILDYKAEGIKPLIDSLSRQGQQKRTSKGKGKSKGSASSTGSFRSAPALIKIFMIVGFIIFIGGGIYATYIDFASDATIVFIGFGLFVIGFIAWGISILVRGIKN